MNSEKVVVLVISLITWAGVFGYLLRLDRLAKQLETEVAARESEKSASSVTTNS